MTKVIVPPFFSFSDSVLVRSTDLMERNDEKNT